MKVNSRLGLMLGLAALVLVACKEDKTAKSEQPEDQFGSRFAEAFNAKSNAKPIDPQKGDADRKNSNGDPVDF